MAEPCLEFTITTRTIDARATLHMSSRFECNPTRGVELARFVNTENGGRVL